MDTSISISKVQMKPKFTWGMRQRASIRSFAKAAGTLTKAGEETLNALDTLDRIEISKKQSGATAKKVRRGFSILDSLSGAGSASTSRQAASKAGSYSAQALGYAQQAKEAAAMGDERKAAELNNKALVASDNANKMRAEEARLSRKESEDRVAKIRRERKEAIAQHKAEEKAREALAAAKRQRLEEARQKASAAKNHLYEAQKAKRERKAAEAEVWGKRVEEGQFWIRQMQLVQEGTHPSQAVTRAQIQAFRDASVAVADITPDLTHSAIAA